MLLLLNEHYSDQSLNIVNKTPNASAAASASLKLTVWPGVKQLMRPQASV